MSLVFLCDCKDIREEHWGIRVWVFRRILGHEREDIRAGWWRSHSEELHDLFLVCNIIF